MKRISLILLLAIAATGQNLKRDDALSPKDFEYRATLDVEQPAEYASVRLDRQFYERTAGQFRDLRIFGPGGEAVPWVIRDMHAFAPREPLRPRILDRVLTPEGELEFVVDFGGSAPVHNRLVIETTETNFRCRTRLESSDDRQRWSFVRDAALLRFDQDARRLESLAIDYPDSTRQYLRLTVENWPRPEALTGVVSELDPVNAEDWEPLAAVVPRVSTLKNQRATQLDVEFPFRWLGDARFTLESDSKEFWRSVELSHSADGKLWSSQYNFVIYRVAGADQLSLRARSVATQHVRLVISNRDDAPLAVSKVRLDVPARQIVFPAPSPGPYAFYLGRDGTPSPEYDLPVILSRRNRVEPARLTASAWERNAEYVAPVPPPKPFSERFPYVLPGVMGVAVACMGYAALRLIRKAS